MLKFIVRIGRIKMEKVKVTYLGKSYLYPRDITLEDISKDFSRREAFSLSGTDENFMNSEIQKAVSTMEKDQSLQQFQYFVGDSNILVDDADGIVIRK